MQNSFGGYGIAQPSASTGEQMMVMAIMTRSPGSFRGADEPVPDRGARAVRPSELPAKARSQTRCMAILVR